MFLHQEVVEHIMFNVVLRWLAAIDTTTVRAYEGKLKHISRVVTLDTYHMC